MSSSNTKPNINTDELHKNFMNDLEALLIKYEAELQYEDEVEGISVNYIGTRKEQNFNGFWRSLGHYLYPGCDEFVEATDGQSDDQEPLCAREKP